MRVIMVTSSHFPPEEGIGSYVLNLSSALTKKGHTVLIITRGSFKISSKTINNIRIVAIPYLPLYPIHLYIHAIFVNEFIHAISKNFDVIHIHTPLPPIIKTSLPVVTTIHTLMKIDSNYIENLGISSKIRKIIANTFSYHVEMKILKYSNIILSVAVHDNDELALYSLPPNKVFPIENGIVLPYPQLCKKVNKNTKFLILYVGRLGLRKGLFDLLAAAKIVCKKKPNAYFIIAGKGELYSLLQKRIIELGLKEQVILTGFLERDKLIALYKKATLYVLPSYYEGLPTSLLEAMSFSLPVIATSIKCNINVINSGNNGILIPARSPNSLANAIIDLLNNAELRLFLGTNGRRTVMTRFNWDHIANKMINYYESNILK